MSLFESLFSLLGPLAAEYTALGRLRERNGSRSKNAGPRGCYRTSDGRFIAVSGSTPKMAERFLQAYGLDDLLRDDRFATNEARVRHAAALDERIACAIAARTLEENLRIIETNDLTAVAVQTVADIEAGSALASATTVGRCAEWPRHRPHAQRRFRGCRRRPARFATRAARSGRTTTPSTARNWGSLADQRDGLRQGGII